MIPSGNTQSVMIAAEVFQPPWREVQPNGQLGPEYGPPSPSALARAASKFANWAYRKPPQVAKDVNPDTAMRLLKFMRGPDGGLRTDVPKREVDVYLAVYEQGHNVKWTARHLGIRRETVKVYIKRLKERAGGA